MVTECAQSVLPSYYGQNSHAFSVAHGIRWYHLLLRWSIFGGKYSADDSAYWLLVVTWCGDSFGFRLAILNSLSCLCLTILVTQPVHGLLTYKFPCMIMKLFVPGSHSTLLLFATLGDQDVIWTCSLLIGCWQDLSVVHEWCPVGAPLRVCISR